MNHMSVLQSVWDNLASWPLLLPELLVAATIVVILVLAFLMPQYQHYWLLPVASVGTFLAWYSKYSLGHQLAPHRVRPLYNQLLVLDPLAIFFCLLLLSITLILLPVNASKAQSASNKSYRPTYVVLLLGTLLGSCLLVMAFHWLTSYLSLTLLSLTSALLIGIHKTPQSAEASLKYLLYSMATTAVMLWGMAYYYGSTGTLALSHPGWDSSVQNMPGYIVLTIIWLCLSSVFFVLAAIPYHVWVPDVYQGAPAAVVAYLSTVPKLATVAFLLRFFHQHLLQLGPILSQYAQQGMAILALLTIVVSNSVALLQNNLQRLMAYGGIAQGGLLMAGIAATTDGQLGVLYYSAVYGVMSLAAWVGIKLLQQHLAGAVYLQDYVGLGRQLPMLGGSITLVMVSLVGLPPTAGFIGKFMIFTSLWEHIQRTGSLLFIALLVAACLGTVLSLYYYLKLPYKLFCKAAQPPPTTIKVDHTDQIILWCLVALLLVGFFASSSLIEIIRNWI